MSHVVILNGPAGVGKTTVARTLAGKLPGTINVSGDTLLTFSPRDVRNYLGPGSTYHAGAALVRSYIEMRAPRVLFEYVFSRRQNIETFCRGLRPDTPVYVFTIWAPFEMVEQREATRPGRERLGPRVLDTYQTLQHNLGELGHVIHNTGPLDDTIAAIADIIATGEVTPAGSFAPARSNA
ncbi:MAG TPA: AAA family ATPase [Devosiaceae bacterium]|jgi:chloramphenicol 3-O-phosphotransferase